MNNHSKLTVMPLWKWILLIVVSFLIFMTLYLFSQSFSFEIPSRALRSFYHIACGAFVLGLYVAWRKCIEKEHPTEVINSSAGKNLCKGLGIGLLIIVATTAILMLTGCCQFTLSDFRWPDIIMFFTFYLFVAISEEIVYRGFMFRMISNRWGFLPALIVSAIAFGLLHLSSDEGSLWGAVAISIEAGLLFGAAYHYARSLWLPIGMHWAWNFTEGDIFGFQVSGGDGGYSILQPIFFGPSILTGGDYGPEASIITVVIGLVLSISLIVKSEKGSAI